MNKIKRIVAVLLLCVVALSCAGCDYLDDLRQNHGLYTDQTGLEIELDGATYKLLPEHPLLVLVAGNDRAVYITQSDVPLLLSSCLGSIAAISDDEKLLEACGNAENSLYYAREDCYASFLAQIEQGPALSKVCFEYWDEQTYEYSLIWLTAEQQQALEQVLAGEPKALGDAAYNEDYSVYLDRSTPDGYFREGLGVLSVLNGECRLIYTDAAVNDYIYTIPQELQPLFHQLLKPYVEGLMIE